VRSSVQSIVHSPTLRVPKPIWAGVIEMFWIFIGDLNAVNWRDWRYSWSNGRRSAAELKVSEQL